MGTALARALHREGHRIEVVITKHASSARRAAGLIGGGPSQLTARQLAKPSPSSLAQLFRSDLFLISTPDDALKPAAMQLAQLIARSAADRTQRPRVALHTSGATSSGILSPLTSEGFAIGSMHPLVSIADAAKAREPFRGAHFCIEGEHAAARVARGLVHDLGGHSFTIPAEAKPLYHAAAALSSGHVVALVDVAIEMLEVCGLSRRRAQEILAPLLASTVVNLTLKTPAKALTGPLARGDIATIRKHLKAMKSKQLNDATQFYGMLGLRILRLAETTNQDRTLMADIAKLISH